MKKLVQAIGEQQLSMKSMLAALGLRDRVNFLNLYLMPSIQEGLVLMLYPDSPRHPRQKYLLSAKGLALYHEKGEPLR